ncbi:MAG: YidC/Oxa1 family membrane protein insertase [Clostridia bacterium]
MIEAISNIFGAIVRVIYNLVQNDYALSIIIFTILTKLILFPLTFKQLKSTEEMNKVKPLYDNIMKKYKNDKVKQSEEITKLYSQHKINPLGGCLPLLIQLPLILAMFYIVRQPLTYITQTPTEEIKTYTQQILNKEDVSKTEMSSSEIQIANKEKLIDMNFFGLNLGDTPSNVFNKDENKRSNPYSLIIPAMTLLLSIYQVKQMQKNSTMTEEQMEMQKSMNLMMPMMSGFIAYTMPLALGLYWMVGTIFQIGQQAILTEIFKKDSIKIGGSINEKN